MASSMMYGVLLGVLLAALNILKSPIAWTAFWSAQAILLVIYTRLTWKRTGLMWMTLGGAHAALVALLLIPASLAGYTLGNVPPLLIALNLVALLAVLPSSDDGPSRSVSSVEAPHAERDALGHAAVPPYPVPQMTRCAEVSMLRWLRALITIAPLVAASAAIVCEVSAQAPANGPMRVALLVDTSEAAAPAISQLRTGVVAFIDALPPEHEIGPGEHRTTGAGARATHDRSQEAHSRRQRTALRRRSNAARGRTPRSERPIHEESGPPGVRHRDRRRPGQQHSH